MTTITHRHAVYLCACGAVRAQCRCLDAAKPRFVVSQTCEACRDQRQPQPGMATFVWDDWAPPRVERQDIPAIIREDTLYAIPPWPVRSVGQLARGEMS